MKQPTNIALKAKDRVLRKNQIQNSKARGHQYRTREEGHNTPSKRSNQRRGATTRDLEQRRIGSWHSHANGHRTIGNSFGQWPQQWKPWPRRWRWRRGRCRRWRQWMWSATQSSIQVALLAAPLYRCERFLQPTIRVESCALRIVQTLCLRFEKSSSSQHEPFLDRVEAGGSLLLETRKENKCSSSEMRRFVNEQEFKCTTISN